MRFAAYNNIAIYGVGETEQEALKAATEKGKTKGMKVAPIQEGFAQDILDIGFDPNHDSFELVDGQIEEV